MSLESSKLSSLSMLKKGRGIKIGHWSNLKWTLSNYPIINFKNKLYPYDRLYLTAKGFIYSTSKGAVVVTPCEELYTTTYKANQALEIAVAQARKKNSKSGGGGSARKKD